MLLAVGFDPFIQNLVNYSPDLVVDASRISRLANTTDYSGLGPLQAAAESSFSSYPRLFAIPDEVLT